MKATTTRQTTIATNICSEVISTEGRAVTSVVEAVGEVVAVGEGEVVVGV